jgi:hypothetical protein
MWLVGWTPLLWQAAKGIAVCNSMVFVAYAARFKTYRNSYLLKANAMATVTGLVFAVIGTSPLFYGQAFQQTQMAPGLLEDREGQKRDVAVNDLLTLCYVQDKIN